MEKLYWNKIINKIHSPNKIVYRQGFKNNN